LFENGLCGITGSSEWGGDDTIEADGGEVACGRGGLEATGCVEVGVELALDDAGGVFVGFSVAYDEDPKLIWRRMGRRRGRHC
jgi:hypothetical protein